MFYRYDPHSSSAKRIRRGSSDQPHHKDASALLHLNAWAAPSDGHHLLQHVNHVLIGDGKRVLKRQSLRAAPTEVS